MRGLMGSRSCTTGQGDDIDHLAMPEGPALPPPPPHPPPPPPHPPRYCWAHVRWGDIAALRHVVEGGAVCSKIWKASSKILGED